MKNFFLILFVSTFLFSCKDKQNDPPAVSHTWGQLASYPVNGNGSYIIFTGEKMVVAHNGNAYDGLSGIFVSSDFGNSWGAKNTNLNSGVSGLYPVDQYLYAALPEDGVMKSGNFGDSWSGMNNGLPDDIRIMNMNRGDNALYLCTNRGLFRLFFNDTIWRNINAPTEPQTFSALGVTNVLFSSGTNGTYRSADDGATWEKLDTVSGLKDQIIGCFFHNNNRIFAAGKTDLSQGGVYYSDDAGLTWNKATGLDDNGYNGVYCFVSWNQALFAATGNGVYKSTDNGAQWQNTGCPNAMSLAVHENFLYAGTGFHGIWKIQL